MEKDPPLQNPDPQGWGTQTRFSELGRGHAPYNLDDLLYLTEGEAAARDGDGAAKFFGGFDPFRYGNHRQAAGRSRGAQEPRPGSPRGPGRGRLPFGSVLPLSGEPTARTLSSGFRRLLKGTECLRTLLQRG